MADFDNLKLKIPAEAALQAIYPTLVKLQSFAHTYSEAADKPGTQVVIPSFADLSAASDFQEGTNDYGTGVNEIKSESVSLNHHLCKSIAISDRALGEVDVDFLRDGAKALADVMGRGIQKAVFGMFNDTNISLSATFDVGTKQAPTVHKLYQIAAENGLDVEDSVVVLDPKNYADLLGVTDYAMFGGREGVLYSWVPNLYGFTAVVCSQDLDSNWNGVIINRNSVGIASRWVEPLPGAYPMAWKATDPDSGFTLGYRVFEDLAKGQRRMSVDCLFGCGILYGGKKAVLLKNT